MFNPDVIAAVKAAKFYRVVIYPAVRGDVVSECWWRWQTSKPCWGTQTAFAG